MAFPKLSFCQGWRALLLLLVYSEVACSQLTELPPAKSEALADAGECQMEIREFQAQKR